uniref:Uncharacterized protein n=1 Tax=Polysiphonia infestans TaxID=2006978 RepID=A0A1Z1MF25_9FLOR|nr:hypothetical protein [Polysiphonia infestans]ARW64344.1 hypothetical protein [Polysiphonia infestans]
MSNNNFFLRYIQGEWFLQENLFLVKNSKQMKKENFFYFNKIEDYLFYNKKNISVSKINNYTIRLSEPQNNNKKGMNYLFLMNFNKNKAIQYFFHLNFIRKGLFKSKKFHIYEKFTQNEYIYLVNQNIIIIVTLAKNLKGKYLGMKISSCIKKRT